MLELKNVSKIYQTKSQEVRALDNVSLLFDKTGLVFITGKSGSGKTTLLNVIGGLDDFTNGEILIKDRSTKDFTKSDYDSYRNTYIGFVFQEYNLLENMTIEKNIALATQLQGQKDDIKRVEKILAKVDLQDIASRKPQELSGGQRQRVAIARALVKNPSIIMADEPTGALDSENGLQIMTLLKKLSKEKLVIVVSHDLDLADRFADRIINLKDGQVESDITISIDEKNKNNIIENNKILSIKRGAKLNSNDIKHITTAVEEGKDIVVSDNINVTKHKTEIKAKTSYNKPTHFIKTHLSFFNTAKLGMSTLKTKRIRLSITIILCALAFSIFGIFDALAIYDEGRLSANTLKASITPSVTISTTIKENNNSYDINVNDTLLSTIEKQTKYDVKGVYNSYYIGTGTPTELANNNAYRVSKYYYYKNLRGAIEFDNDDLDKYKFSMTAGRLPEEFDEIAISDYFAMCMYNWWYTYKDPEGETKILQSVNELVNEQNPLKLTLGTTGYKTSYKIVGIVNTGTINKKFNHMKEKFEECSSLDQNEFFNYINNGYFLYAFVKQGFASYAVMQRNTLNKYINKAYTYQFTTNDTNIKSIRDSFYDFNELKKLTKNYVFINEGKTELGENEILVDASQLQILYLDLITKLKEVGEKDPRFTNDIANINANLTTIVNNKSTPEEKLTALQTAIAKLDEIQAAIDKVSGVARTESIFNREFNVKKLDLSQYQPGTTKPVESTVKNSKYKIVGFYTGVDVSKSNSMVMLTSSISNLGISLMQGAYSSFLATNTGKGNIGALSNLLLKNSGVCYDCKNNAIALIRANSDFFSNLSLLFLIVSGIFAVFSVVMFSNFISTSIKNKYGEIGILRALGARGTDILKMFVVEAVAIALINAVCASIIAGIGCIFVNMFLSNYLSLYIPLAAFGIRQVLVIFGLSIAVGIISAILPIINVSKQKPVETIRKAF